MEHTAIKHLDECHDASERITDALSLLNESIADAHKLGMYILIDKEIKVHETDKLPPKIPVRYVLTKATYSVDFSSK